MKLFVVLAVVALVGCSLVEGRSLFARATKEELTTKGNDLVKKVDEAITKLTADKKTHEVAILKHEETNLKKHIADLTAATETAAITRIEHELARLEARIAHQLEAFAKPAPVPANPPTKRDTKSDLTTKGTELTTKLDAAITKLTADKKTHEVAILKHEETLLKKLVADLTAATETAAITRIEHELGRLEARVTHQLAAIDKTPAVPANPPTKRDTKSDLTTKGTELTTKLDAAITKLTADKKTHEVAILKREETILKKLVADLTAATETAAITRIEHELGRLEARVTHQLAAIDKTPAVPANPPTPTKRATKEELTTKGNDLIKKADEAVTKLTADKKTHEATVIKSEEAKIKKLIADLTAATDEAKIKHIEHDLTIAESKLAHELAKVNATPKVPANPPTKRATKEELTTKGNDLLKKADEAVTKLTADKKTHEVTVIKSEEAKIKKLIADLTAATDEAKIKHIEHDLTIAESKLAHELTKVNAAPKPPTTSN